MRFPFATTIAIAHRGAHDAEHPENSWAAVDLAIRIGAPAVEFDVWNLRDGRFVVTHDSPSEADRQLARVEPFLEVIAGSSVLLNLDWKGSGGEHRVGRLLTSYGLVERTIVSAEDPMALVRLKDAAPRLATGLSWESVMPAGRVPAQLHAARADALMLDYRFATVPLLEAVRAADAGVFLWTVSDRATFERLLALRPDGIATDAIAELLHPTR